MRSCSLIVPLCLLAAASVRGDVAIVAAGRPPAQIVVGAQPTPTERLAAAEFQWHVLKMSGAKLPIVAAPKAGTVVYIGRAARAVGVQASGLELEHYRIKTGDHWLAIAGRDGTMVEGRDDPLDLGNVQVGTLFGVYHLLDRVLGVRWLWPGELGTFVPQRSTVTVPALDVTDGPKLMRRNFRCHRAKRRRVKFLGGIDGVTMIPDDVAERLRVDEVMWLRRHVMGRRTRFAFGHSFTRWWKQYGKSHPEYFAKLPARKQPYPKPDRVKLCVSTKAVTDQIIADWKGRGATGHLAACPNDSRAFCTCERCRQWDLPVATAPEDVDASVLTYRYVKFWQILCEQVAAANPHVYVCGYAYSNYRTPPDNVKLPSNLLLGYVNSMDEEAIEGWRKWSEAGAMLYLRPNWFHAGHNTYHLPLTQAARFLKYAHAHNMLGTDFDSLLGHYSTQGPLYYLVARLQTRPELSVQQIVGEYCAAFGPASDRVRQFIGYWEEHTPQYAAKAQALAEAMRGAKRSYVRLMPEMLSDEALAPAERLLNEAQRQVAGADAIFTKRVEFLRKGLEHLRLEREAVRHGQNTGSVRGIRENALKAVAATNALREFRKTIQDSFVDWAEYCDMKEITIGDFTGLRLTSALRGRDALAVLPAAWYFQWDPHDVGEKQGWFEAKFDPRKATWPRTQIYRWWERNDIGKKWKAEHGKDYDGVAWYRTRFTPPALPKGARAKLLFGAVDESCKVWVNGRFVGEHPFVKPDDWKIPFEFDVTDFLVEGQNQIAVRVVDNAGAGGIWKLVWLLAE